MILTSRSSSSAVKRRVVCSMVLVGLLGPAAQHSFGGLFTLLDDNSTAHFSTGAQVNNDAWVVDGISQLHSQAFWFRLGDDPEQSIHTALVIGTEGTSDLNFDGNPDALFVRYLDPSNRFKIETRYTLDGGAPGSNSSDLGEQITITSTSATPLNFHFYQYADFDLRSTPGGDTVVFTNPNGVRQSQGPGEVSETVLTPVASHREVAFFPATLNALNDGSPTVLSDTNGPIGPGNVTWANEWDFLLQPNSSFGISKDKRLAGVAEVPEPTGLLLSLTAGLLLVAHRKRRIALT
jgi:hypothetical protein